MPSLYDFKHNFVFVHIPKNAGSSASNYFVKSSLILNLGISEASFDALENTAENNIPKELQGKSTPQVITNIPNLETCFKANNKADPENRYWQINQARARDIRDALTPRVFDEMHSVAFVRNPWDRLGSFYHYIRRNPENPMHLKVKKMSFNEYVCWQCENRPNRQTSWITDLDQKVIVKYVCRVENLKGEIERMSKIIFGKAFKFPHKNKTKNQWHSDIFDSQSIDLVRQTFRSDFDVLGYEDMPEEAESSDL